MTTQANLQPTITIKSPGEVERPTDDRIQTATDTRRRKVFEKMIHQGKLGKEMECSASVCDRSSQSRERSVGTDHTLQGLRVPLGPLQDGCLHLLPDKSVRPRVQLDQREQQRMDGGAVVVINANRGRIRIDPIAKIPFIEAVECILDVTTLEATPLTGKEGLDEGTEKQPAEVMDSQSFSFQF